MRIMLLKAGRGDSLLLSWKEHNMLIDSETPATLRKNRNPKLPPLKDIDFFVLTHIDFDHIGGFIDVLKKSDITNFHENLVFYANQLELITCKDNENVGYHHGRFLSDHIKRLGINNQGLKYGDFFNIDDAIFTVLSPEEEHLQILAKRWGDLESEYDQIPELNTFVSMKNKEFEVCLDKSNKEFKHEPESDIINFSSIALFISYYDKTILLSGDSHVRSRDRTR